MGLEEISGTNYTQQDVEEHGRTLLDKYGVDACEAASVIDDVNVTESTAQSYKPQIRQILHHCSTTTPTPRMVVDQISDTDKKSGTKSLMVSAMERYYKAIGEPSNADDLRKLSNQEGITEKNFDTESEISGWITKDEVDTIENQILPGESQKVNRLSFADSSWVITSEHRALTMCLFYTACRVGEICRRDSDDQALSVEDVDFNQNKIELYRLKKGGKGYKRDMTAVPGKLIDALSDYMDLYDITEGHIFPFTTRTAQNRIKDVNDAYQHAFGEFEHMDTLTPHKFRHGRITDIANNSSLEDAGQYVDHASPETTNQYRHMATEEQRDILPEEASGGSELDELMAKLDVSNVDQAIDKLESLSEE